MPTIVAHQKLLARNGHVWRVTPEGLPHVLRFAKQSVWGGVPQVAGPTTRDHLRQWFSLRESPRPVS